MSRHASRPGLRRVATGACFLLSVTGQAQTIADYSRAQRTVLENAMMQATARSAGLAASAPAVPAQAAPTPPPAVPLPGGGRAPLEQAVADPRVSGVFASAAGATTEVCVNGTPYLLVAGQPVPGTPWRVESVAIDRVVLSRRDAPGGGVVSGSTRRVFALPPLR
jgi:type IV pilus biogenesis protein PilP